jgi:hypothetical protein
VMTDNGYVCSIDDRTIKVTTPSANRTLSSRPKSHCDACPSAAMTALIPTGLTAR